MLLRRRSREVKRDGCNLGLNVRMASQDGSVKNVVIAGAGPAGLMLAHYLMGCDKGFKVIILEQRQCLLSLASFLLQAFSFSLGLALS